MHKFDVAIIGAGAAGMMAAAVAGQRGRRVVLIDHAKKLAEKIRISGGGRCNFTNLRVQPDHFLSENPHFCRSALASYTPQDFIKLIKQYRVGYHEKHRGQLFCDDSSQRIIDLLVAECGLGKVAWRRPCEVHAINKTGDAFSLQTDTGTIEALSLVIATGGLSIPKIGATDFGYRVARQFDLPLVAPHPGLVPLVFDPATWEPFTKLAGLSLAVEVKCGKGRFHEDLLFTHRGLSGPAILQISSFWQPGDALTLDLIPGLKVEEELVKAKVGNRQQLTTVLTQYLPKRLADLWVTRSGLGERFIAEVSDQALRKLGESLNNWQLTPAGSEGYRKAEVTRGGIDTRVLNSKTMGVQAIPGLHFIGEVVDVTGWLGGYNFQWAWASAVAAGMVV